MSTDLANTSAGKVDVISPEDYLKIASENLRTLLIQQQIINSQAKTIHEYAKIEQARRNDNQIAGAATAAASVATAIFTLYKIFSK